jgi:hypothetical protein
VGEGIWYDIFQIQNTKWLCLVNGTLAVMNTDDIQCGCFGLYLSCVAGILHSVKEIHFYVLCNAKLYYADYIAKCIAGKMYCISYKSHTEVYFRLSSAGKTDAFSFEARLIHGQYTCENDNIAKPWKRVSNRLT